MDITLSKHAYSFPMTIPLTHLGIARPYGNWLVKVPEVTAFFWIIKVLATTVGETFADFLNSIPGVGPARFLSPELEAATLLVNSGAVVGAAREVIEELI